MHPFVPKKISPQEMRFTYSGVLFAAVLRNMPHIELASLLVLVNLLTSLLPISEKYRIIGKAAE